MGFLLSAPVSEQHIPDDFLASLYICYRLFFRAKALREKISSSQPKRQQAATTGTQSAGLQEQNSATAKELNKMDAEIRITTMLVLIIAAFLVCHTPVRKKMQKIYAFQLIF